MRLRMLCTLPNEGFFYGIFVNIGDRSEQRLCSEDSAVLHIVLKIDDSLFDL